MNKLLQLLSRAEVLVPLVITAFIILLSTAVTTCHTTPAGILTKKQERAKVASADQAVATARALRKLAQAYEDTATLYAHAPPTALPAADTSSLPAFWAKYFAH